MKGKGKYSKLFKATLATSLATSAIVATAPVYSQAEVKSFTDVKKGQYFYESVQSLSTRGIINGFEDGTFKPGENISRAHAAKIIALALGLDTKNVKDPGFKDVSKDHPYYGHIAALVNAGIIKGYEDNTFKPTGNLTRAHVAQILVLGFDFKEEQYSDLPFKDVNDKQWFVDYIQTLYSKEITNGTTPTTFAPNNNVTRGQFATFIYRSEQTVQQESVEVMNISNNQIELSNGKYTVSESLQKVFNTSNLAALKGAKIKYTAANNEIVSVESLELKASGDATNSLILDAKGEIFAGDITVSGDYVSLVNITVKGDLEIAGSVKNSFTANALKVEGNTRISEKSVSGARANYIASLSFAAINPIPTFIFTNSTIGNVQITKKDATFEVKGTTTINTVSVSSNATLKADKGVSIPEVKLLSGTTQVTIDAKVDKLSVNSTGALTLNGSGDIGEVTVESQKEVKLDSTGKIAKLEIKSKDSKISFGSNSKIGNLVLPKGREAKDIIQDYDKVKGNVEQIGGKNNPDTPPTPSTPSTGGNTGGGSTGSGNSDSNNSGTNTGQPATRDIADLTIGVDNTGAITGDTATNGGKLKYLLVDTSKVKQINTWNVETSEVDVNTALGGTLGTTKPTITNVDNAKFLVVVEIKDDKVVAAGQSSAIGVSPSEADTTPPIFDMPRFGVVNATTTTVDLMVKVDEDATGYYVVVPYSEESPHPEQVKQGKDASDKPAFKHGSFSLSANTQKTATISGLEADTKYQLLMFVEDKHGNATNLQLFTPTTLKDQTAPTTDQQAADEVTAKITALPAEITLADEIAVDVAKAAFDGLTATQQALVSEENRTKLTEAVAKIVQLHEQDEDSLTQTGVLDDLPIQVNLEEELRIALKDNDVATTDTVTVKVTTNTDSTGKEVLLTWNALTSKFEGSIQVSATAGQGKIQATSGDTVTLTYVDEENASGVEESITKTTIARHQTEVTVPTVTLVSNMPTFVNYGETVPARSNMTGALYLVQQIENPTLERDLDALVEAGKAQKVYVTEANYDVEIPTTGLFVGKYKVYAVSSEGTLSFPSESIHYVPAGVTYASGTSQLDATGKVQNTITWTRDNSIGVDRYSIIRRESVGAEDYGHDSRGTTITSGLPVETETFTDTDVELGKTYFYYVISYSARDAQDDGTGIVVTPGLKVVTVGDQSEVTDISDLTIGVDNTGAITGDTATNGGTLKYILVNASKSNQINTWNVETTEVDVETILGGSLAAIKPIITDEDYAKFLVVVEIKNGKVVAAGQSSAINVSPSGGDTTPTFPALNIIKFKRDYHLNEPFDYDFLQFRNANWEVLIIDKKDIKIEGFDSSHYQEGQEVKITVNGITETKTVDILPGGPIKLIADDNLDTIFGLDTTMEFRVEDTENWIKYDGENLPDLSGRKGISVRYSATLDRIYSHTKDFGFTNGYFLLDNNDKIGIPTDKLTFVWNVGQLDDLNLTSLQNKKNDELFEHGLDFLNVFGDQDIKITNVTWDNSGDKLKSTFTLAESINLKETLGLSFGLKGMDELDYWAGYIYIALYKASDNELLDLLLKEVASHEVYSISNIEEIFEYMSAEEFHGAPKEKIINNYISSFTDQYVEELESSSSEIESISNLQELINKVDKEQFIKESPSIQEEVNNLKELLAFSSKHKAEVGQETFDSLAELVPTILILFAEFDIVNETISIEQLIKTYFQMEEKLNNASELKWDLIFDLKEIEEVKQIQQELDSFYTSYGLLKADVTQEMVESLENKIKALPKDLRDACDFDNAIKNIKAFLEEINIDNLDNN